MHINSRWTEVQSREQKGAKASGRGWWLVVRRWKSPELKLLLKRLLFLAILPWIKYFQNLLFNFPHSSFKTRRTKKSIQDLKRNILSGRRLLNFRENLRLSCWRPGMRLLIWDRWWISRIQATKNYIHNQVESVLGNDKTTKEQLGDEERKKFKWLYSQVEYHHLQK